MKDLLQNRWTKFGFWALLYLLWVIWVGNYWWLFGLIIIFDSHITKKVKWAFWKKNYKEGEKHNVFLDWLDAIIFAVVVVTFVNIFFFQAYKIPTSSMERSLMTGDYLFVSKLSYGPKLPERPLSIPFTHNVIMGKKSYSDILKFDYRRIAGFSNVKNGDIVVFNWPHGDTVLTRVPTDDYYTHVRMNGREFTQQQYGPIVVRPRDKKDNYVKRAIAIAGDTFEIRSGVAYINGKAEEQFEGIQRTYTVITKGSAINTKHLSDIGLNVEEFWFDATLPGYPAMPLRAKDIEKVTNFGNVVSVTPNIDVYPHDYPDSPNMIFPFDNNNTWTRDNYGPLYIPAKGDEVSLTIENLPLYRRIITAYESNTLEVKDGKIFINGQEKSSYTFKQDYYFMMGDNRHNSLDSRYWGFVPEDHIVGKPSVVWFSTDSNKKFPKNIRWNRLLKFV